MTKQQVEHGWELYNDWRNHLSSASKELKYDRLSEYTNQYLNHPNLSYLGMYEVYSLVRDANKTVKEVFKILQIIGVEVTDE